MKIFSLLTACAICSPAMVLAQDWSGVRVALNVAQASGYRDAFNSGVFAGRNDIDGRLNGISLGYDVQNGNFVYGGEIGWSSGELTFEGLSEENYLDGMLDVKARLGYATGKILWYGTLGWARSERYFVNPVVSNEPVQSDGMSFGLGVEALVTDRVFVGLELQQRNLSSDEGDVGGFPDDAFDYRVRTVGLRVGFKF